MGVALARQQRQFADQGLDQGRLAGAVGAEQADAVASLKTKTDVVQDGDRAGLCRRRARVCRVAAIGMVEPHQRMRQLQRRREIDAYLAFGANALGVGHLGQPLDPRLRLLGLRRAGAETVDEALQVRAFGLHLLVGDLLQPQLLRALVLERGVVAGVELRLAPMQVQRVGGDVVQELAVVRDQQQRAGIFQQPLLEPQHRVEVEVVGGLVEQQQVRRRHQRARQVQAHPPAAGERGHRVVVGIGREPQSVQQLAGARGAVVAADFLEPVVGFGHRFPVFVGEGIGLGLQRRVHHRVAAEHEVDRRIGQRRHLLGDARHAHPGRQVEVAQVGFHLAAYGGEQGRLARAVAADHAHAPAGMQGEVDVGQQQALAAPEREILEGDHGARILQGAAAPRRQAFCTSDPRLFGSGFSRELLLAPSPCGGRGRLGGVPAVPGDPEDTPPQPSPAFAGEGADQPLQRRGSQPPHRHPPRRRIQTPRFHSRRPDPSFPRRRKAPFNSPKDGPSSDLGS